MRRMGAVRLLGRMLVVALLLGSGLTAVGVVEVPAASADPSPAPAGAQQLITVNAPTSSATSATLSAWERGADGVWHRVLAPMPAEVGGAGIGSASEGSQRTPAGTFALTQAFGRQANPNTKMPYFTTDQLDWWDENPQSPTYNLHVRQPASPGAASENLYDSGPVYDYVVNMDYNLARVPYAGSAFFLHVTDGTPTAGCVAVSEAGMVAILRWLDPAKHPFISVSVGAAWQPGPVGVIDSVKMSGVQQISVSGWAVDPASPASSEQVHVYVSGPAGTMGYAGTMTTGGRADVEAAHPWANSTTGFSSTVRAEGAGPNTVCVYAIRVTPPGSNPLLGCRTILVANPFGIADSVSASGDTITAAGWALNPNNHAERVQIHLYDTSSAGVVGYPGIMAGAARVDVARAFPGYGAAHGYRATIPARVKGSHKVCAFAIATSGGWNNPLLGCHTVIVS